MERGWREVTPNCPRCGSCNTKFCYYNNYSFTQPRYFCKGCRRYWTKGGSIRNVPVGGGCRKSRRSRSSNPHHRGVYSFRNSSNTNSTNMVEPTPSLTNHDQTAPAIDLGLVYANFLSPKDGSSDSMSVELQDDRSNTTNSRAMLLHQEHANIVDCISNPPFSGRFSTIPLISNGLDHDQIFLPDFSREVSVQHRHEKVSTCVDILELLPLPGESVSQEHSFVSWPPSTFNDHDHHIHLGTHPRAAIPDLEPDFRGSNIFMGSWSPLDLPGFETSSSMPQL